MLNRTPGTAPSPEDLAAEDLRIEVAAARETALSLALRIVPERTLDDALFNAGCFEEFLLEHQSNGQQALETALTLVQRRNVGGPIAEIITTATRFCNYLDHGHPNGF